MKEETFCPHCDELVTFEFDDDYYETEQGEEADVIECSKCKKQVGMAWEVEHRYVFYKKVN